MSAVKVGLSGGIGSGKSTVSARLAELGAVIIDADRIAREVVEPGTEGLAALRARFGDEIIDADGALIRPRLGQIVFSDPQALADLNAITHPLIGRRTAELLAQAPADAVIVHDVPLLVENGMHARFDLVVIVHASAQTRVRRLVEHRGMTEADALARIAAQATDEERRAVADVWLDNEGTADDLRAAVDRLWSDRIRPLVGATTSA